LDALFRKMKRAATGRFLRAGFHLPGIRERPAYTTALTPVGLTIFAVSRPAVLPATLIMAGFSGALK
jgi:hypothetical protein